MQRLKEDILIEMLGLGYCGRWRWGERALDKGLPTRWIGERVSEVAASRFEEPRGGKWIVKDSKDKCMRLGRRKRSQTDKRG